MERIIKLIVATATLLCLTADPVKARTTDTTVFMGLQVIKMSDESIDVRNANRVINECKIMKIRFTNYVDHKENKYSCGGLALKFDKISCVISEEIFNYDKHSICQFMKQNVTIDSNADVAKEFISLRNNRDGRC